MHLWNLQIIASFIKNNRGIFLADKRMLVYTFVFTIVFLALLFWFFGFGKPAKFSDIKVGGRDFKVWLADTPASRTKGLSGKELMSEDEGMFFIFDSPGDYGFWMKGMLFPIDIVWIRGDKVVSFSENVSPEPGKSIFGLTTYHPSEPVDRVLELNAGMVAKYGLKVGDMIEFKL